MDSALPESDLGTSTRPAHWAAMWVSKSDRHWALLFAFLVMLTTSLPYLLAYGNQGDAHLFSGFLWGVTDGNSYIAKMLSGTQEVWLFRTPYTAYPQRGVLMFLPYILLGKLAGPPGLHEQLVALYHLFRFGAGMLAILATNDFLAFFLEGVRLRRFGLALATLGGGLGWLLIILGQNNWLGSLPLAFNSPESFGFLGLYGIPHLAASRALLLWALLVYLRAVVERDQPKWHSNRALRLSLLWLGAGLLQPLSMLVIGAVLICHLVGLGFWQFARGRKDLSTEWASWRRLARLVILAGIAPGLLVLNNLWAVMRDPFVAAWTEQNIITSPHPAHYFLAYGLVLPYAVVGGARLLRRTPWVGWLLVGWIALLPILAYAPVDLQRRLPEGIWIAWVVLAMASLDRVQCRESQVPAGRRIALFIPLLLAFPSTLFLFVGGLMAARGPGIPVFLPESEVEVFEYLGENAQPNQVVLASFETANPLPAWASVRVLVGHGPESINQAELLPLVKAFYSLETPDAARLELIQQFDVEYVFWGPAERALGDWNPHQAMFLELLYKAGNYEVFRVGGG